MEESHLVSVIIPTYNSENYIIDTIASVQNQTYKNWEILLVDDGSTDNTIAVISKLKEVDNRIEVTILDKNSGTGVARNEALRKAQGKYIAFLDADDLWKPDKLQKQIDFMQLHSLPFTFSFYDYINEKNEVMGVRVKAPQPLSYRQLFFCNYIGNLTGIYDVGYFGKVPILPIRKRQDWMLWLTIVKKINVAIPVPESLAYYRIRNNSLSTAKMDLIKYNFAVYREFHGLNFLHSILCISGFLFAQFFIKPFYIKKIIAWS